MGWKWTCHKYGRWHGGSSKREQLEVAGKGRRVFDEEQMQIEVDFYFVSGEILMMSC